MQESDWCAALVVAMNLLRHISHRDRVPSSRVTCRAHAPLEVVLVLVALGC